MRKLPLDKKGQETVAASAPTPLRTDPLFIKVRGLRGHPASAIRGDGPLMRHWDLLLRVVLQRVRGLVESLR